MMVVILTPVDGIIRWLPRGFSCSPQDHITLEMAPLEIRHRSVRPISAKHAQASRFLQQSPHEY
ncbi:hypothetical protein FPQ51_20905 [Klebsiella pneumoniae]|nr:hypothetical protein FPQ51_20905 [Klebsiella pneumoniae]